MFRLRTIRKSACMETVPYVQSFFTAFSSDFAALAAINSDETHCFAYVPAHSKALERVERKILNDNIHQPFDMIKVAGLGTVRVLCQTKKNAKNVVLMHGYAAGNAFYAAVQVTIAL